MNPRIFVLTAALSVGAALGAWAQPSSVPPISFPVTQGKTYKFEKIADGVYYASGGVGSNNVVVVNDDDVLIVDTGTTPQAARNFLADIKTLTNKPVRYVVNTHFHYDHVDGNQIFGPEVQIIAHDFVRTAISTFDVLHREPYNTSQLVNVPAQIDRLKQQVAAERDAAKKAALSGQLKATEEAFAQLKELKATPPTMTYSSKLVLHRGGREIDLLFLGRGHTGGDTVVFLPKEKIVATGDLMESRLAYMGDAYFDEWVTTLEALKKLDADIVLPGHGIPFRDKGLITAYQAYLNDFIGQAGRLKAQNVSAEDAAKRIDLTAHAKAFPQIEGPGADLRGVRRAYAWIDERAKR
jgi:glyoxylase-like metal-dependent hydrolase (beta-lactamase superfamily II)